MGEEHNEATKKTAKKKFKAFKNKRREKNNAEERELERLQQQYETINIDDIRTFKDFPLSSRTMKGLKDSNYIEPTEIQKQSLGFSLRGLDVLGAAKTGSGKTLAFLIPILECLLLKKWTHLDGVGALVITPTRELAYQIFETLRKVGRYHYFSGGLIIGGKDLKCEKKRMDQCNIIIGTPGRLLQHMDENPLFNYDNMQILVLDEADRCLDMGFQTTMNNIIANLPLTRQTLLFSATQTKSIQDLARLSLKDPMYVSVDEHAKYSTPEGLQQSYIVCELHEKISVLWSFLRNHTKDKIIVFFSTCKQVKYHFETFCQMRPGISLLALYGGLHQMRRMAIYDNFCSKSNAVLFATDIAGRGLDFPAVNWVLQFDCPEDANTYIHRAGRTARFKQGGEALLLLLPSEENGMIEQLKGKRIPIKKIKVNPSKLQTPTKKLQAILAHDIALKETAQRAFVSYLKSVFLAKNKKVFDINVLDTAAYSESLGLAIPPRIRFLKKALNQNGGSKLNIPHSFLKNNRELELKESSNRIESSAIDNQDADIHKDDDNLQIHHNGDCSLQGGCEGDGDRFDNNSDSEDDLFHIKRRDHELDIKPLESSAKIENATKKKFLTKAALTKKILRKKIIPNKKIVFDDEGEVIRNQLREKVSEIGKEYDAENIGGIDIEKAKLALREEDKFDKQLFREKVKAKHREKKLKKKGKVEKESDEEEEEEEEEEGEGEGEVVSDNDNYSDSDSGPDLSWLPDPDKIYGKRRDSNEDSNEENEEKRSVASDSDNQEYSVSKKRKVKEEKQGNKKRKLEETNLVTDPSLLNDEELALYFLQHK